MADQVVTLKVDAAEAAQELRAVVSEISADVSYELNSAIESTARLLQDCPRAIVFARLSAHLDALLAEQLRQVTIKPLPLIERGAA